MARRRTKKTSWGKLPLWVLAMGLIGWSLWQAEMLRRTVSQRGAAAALPAAMAVGTIEAPADDEATVPTMTVAGGGELAEARTAWAVPAEVTGPLEAVPAFEESLSAEELITRGVGLRNEGKAVAARYTLNEALARTSDEGRAGQLRATLAGMNVRVFLGTDVLPEDPSVRLVAIRTGETFLSLGKAYGVPAAFLQRINPRLNALNLRTGAGIKIVQGPFHGRIVKHAGRLDLYARDIYVASCGGDFPEGNYLPRGEYTVAAGTKLQVGAGAGMRTWIGFQGIEEATGGVTSGWIFGSTGPRGTTTKDRATGVHLAEGDLAQLYNVLSEGRSRLRVEP
jgi:hypothetical protein